MVIAIMIACALALIPILLIFISDICRLFEIKFWPVILTALFTLAIGSAVIYSLKMNTSLLNAFDVMYRFHILLHNPYTMEVFVNFAIFVALMAVFGQLLVNRAISSLPDSVMNIDPIEQENIAGKFLFLKEKIKFFLLCDTVLIVFSVITTETLKSAIDTEISVNRVIYPQNFVALYGLLFTFYLALIYIPIFFRLKNKGQSMMGQVILTDEGDEKTKYLSKIFLTQETPLDNLKTALSILAPVLSGLLPNLLKL